MPSATPWTSASSAGNQPVYAPAMVRYYMVAELDWDDMDSLRQDFASPLGQEIADDVHKLAEWCPAIRSMIFELEDL